MVFDSVRKELKDVFMFLLFARSSISSTVAGGLEAQQ